MPSGKSSILVDDEGQFSNAAAKGLANKTTSAIVKQEKKERPGLDCYRLAFVALYNYCSNPHHTVAESKFLSKNSIFMEFPAILNFNFDAKNEILDLIFLNKKLRFATVCPPSLCFHFWQQNSHSSFDKNCSSR